MFSCNTISAARSIVVMFPTFRLQHPSVIRAQKAWLASEEVPKSSEEDVFTLFPQFVLMWVHTCMIGMTIRMLPFSPSSDVHKGMPAAIVMIHRQIWYCRLFGGAQCSEFLHGRKYWLVGMICIDIQCTSRTD